MSGEGEGGGAAGDSSSGGDSSTTGGSGAASRRLRRRRLGDKLRPNLHQNLDAVFSDTKFIRAVSEELSIEMNFEGGESDEIVKKWSESMVQQSG